jgi:putative hydrolase of the HAD superfamily
VSGIPLPTEPTRPVPATGLLPAAPMKFVFDFGAVLFDWRPPALLRQHLPQRVVDEASAAHWVQQFFQDYSGDWGAFDGGTLAADELVARIAARTGLSPAEVQAVVDAVPQALAPLPDSVALLARLRRAAQPLYYLSNMPAPYADHLERTHPFVGWFDDGVFSSRVKLSKPAPAIFALAQQRFGHPGHELVFLDDHPANVAAARAAGWNALLFRDAAQAEADLRAAGWWPAVLD